MSEKIAVAMSGGVDSSVSAFLLKKANFEVHGVTFYLFDSKNSEKAVKDAKKVAESIGIHHFVLDLTREFKSKVIDYFVSEYTNGRTPNPCVICNKNIKFGVALEKLLNLGFKKIATGHYTEITKLNNRFVIKKNNNNKDQSYCFCLLNQEQISKIITPVSKFSKNQVREIAQNNNIFVWDKKDSQDICFIQNSYKDFLREFGIKNKPGNFIDEDGNILGNHNGIFNYTVGQRRGLNISLGKRTYVKKINPVSNEITLSSRYAVKKIILKNINFVSFEFESEFLKKIISKNINIKICVRYNSQLSDAKIQIKNKNEAEIIFENPVFNACPGQFAVCYHDNYLVFGGVIDKIEC